MPKFRHFDHDSHSSPATTQCFDVDYAIADEILRTSNRLGRGLNKEESAVIRHRLEELDAIGHTLLPIIVDEIGANETEQSFAAQLLGHPENLDDLQKMTQASKKIARELGFFRCKVAIHLSRTLPLTKDSPFWGYTEQAYLYDITVAFGDDGKSAYSIMLTCQSFAPYR